MFDFIARRLVSIIPVLAVVALFVFFMLRLTPGDPAAVIAGDNATSDQIADIRDKLGLNLPIWQQFGIWLGKAVRLDFGVMGPNATVTDPDSADFGGGSLTVAISLGLVAGEDVIGLDASGVKGSHGRLPTPGRETSEAPVFICSTREIEQDEIPMTAVKNLALKLQFGSQP